MFPYLTAARPEGPAPITAMRLTCFDIVILEQKSIRCIIDYGVFPLQQPNPESNNGGDSVSDMPINGGWPEMRGPRWTTIAREMR